MENSALMDRLLRHSTALVGLIPIVALSASLTKDQRPCMIETGMDCWILKPIDFKRMSVLLAGISNIRVRRRMCTKGIAAGNMAAGSNHQAHQEWTRLISRRLVRSRGRRLALVLVLIRRYRGSFRPGIFLTCITGEFECWFVSISPRDVAFVYGSCTG
jgi:CheY-like chemotaxis protein